MAQRKTLTEAQVALLRWISDGCPDGSEPSEGYRISAAALRTRGLVSVSGRGSMWSAELTDAGRAYLASTEGPNPPVPRGSVTERLIADIVAAGGSLRLPRTSYRGRGVDYENRANLAIQHGKVPPGKRLEVTLLSWSEMQLDLIDIPEWADASDRPVPVPEHVDRYHDVVRAFRDDTGRQQISRAVLTRTSRILQGLVIEAERRGYVVHPEGGTADPSLSEQRSGFLGGHVVFEDDDFRCGLYIAEVGVTGRLALQLDGHRAGGRQWRWSDRAASTVEKQLPEILAEVATRAAEHRRLKLEAERERLERRRAWEDAMERAHAHYYDKLRAEELDRQLRRWSEADTIRSYCDAIEAAGSTDPGTAEWLSWLRRRADRIDPAITSPKGPTLPEEVAAHELRPFLGGWSPLGPDQRW